MNTVYGRFPVPRTVIGWGYDDDGINPTIEPRSSSGYLLPNVAIDDHREALALRRPDQYVVMGEHRREDGMRFPDLGISPAYMRWLGYETTDGYGRKWRYPEPEPPPRRKRGTAE